MLACLSQHGRVLLVTRCRCWLQDTFEGKCIGHDGLGRWPTNSTAECCAHCVATRGCWSWVVNHAEGICYINRNDIQQGSQIPPDWPTTDGPCTCQLQQLSFLLATAAALFSPGLTEAAAQTPASRCRVPTELPRLRCTMVSVALLSASSQGLSKRQAAAHKLSVTRRSATT